MMLTIFLTLWLCAGLIWCALVLGAVVLEHFRHARKVLDGTTSWEEKQ